MATTLTGEHLAAMEQLKQQKESTKKDLKEQQKKNESYLDKIRSTEDKLFEAQHERTDLQKTNKSLEEVILKLENEIDEKLLKQEMKAVNQQAFDDLELQERAEIAQELQTQLQQMTKHCESIESEKKELEAKLDGLNDEYVKVDGMREKMGDDLKEKQRQIESQELTFSMIKSTCTMLESQIEELEIMLEAFEEKEMKWDIARKTLESNRDNQECSVAEMKRSVEYDKAARSLAEEKLVKFKEGLDEFQNARIREVNDMNEKLERQSKRTDELTELNERIESQISNLRAANFQMNQNIESAVEKYEEVNTERATLAEQIDIMESSYAEERLKLEATKAQQTKLIDFLQYKTEGQNMKKRKLLGGGGKTWRKHHHDERNVVPRQWKDMQQALEKERASSLKLQTELNRTKAELQAAKMEVGQWKSQCQNSGDKKPAQKVAVLSALQQSPSNQQTPLQTLKKNNPTSKPPLPSDPTVHRPKERMHHNIPHSGSVKYGWERKWVMLRDNQIHLFDKENVKDKSSPSEILNLDGTDGHVTIHSSVMSSELLGTAPTDLPYILRIESRPKCWPVQNLYLMAPSFSDKQKWVMALEATLAQIKKVTKEKTAEKSDEKLFGNSLLYLENPDKIDMNCTQLLSDELILVGAEEGLYALSFAKPGRHREIPGIGKVFQISIIADLNLVIMIAGKERNLCCVDLKQLQSRARQVNSEVPLTPLTTQTIEKIKNCHLFAIGQFDGSQFICAATPNKLHLLRFNAGMNAFCVRKEIDTSDPCNCIHFTETSVVYGTDRFYSLDLKQHAITEFLDASDTSLAFAVYGAAQLNIFPIAVLDVTSCDSTNPELLLCYNEFGVFVNSVGRQTRQKTLMWTRLPLAFAYKQPFLFVTHFNSIDVCEIPSVSSSSTNSFTHKFLDIQNPRVLGPAVSPGAVYIVSSMQEQVELLCLQGSSAAASSCQSDEDLSDFSQLSEMLRTISATSLASEVCSPSRGKDDPQKAKKRRSSFLSNGPFKTPNCKSDIDLAFLIEVSKSIANTGFRNHQFLRNFVKQVVLSSIDDVFWPAKELRDDGIQIICVGVGRYFNIRQLNIMASCPAAKNVFTGDFSKIHHVIDDLVEQICKVSNGSLVPAKSHCPCK
ncbi:hypothetical protein QZH41_001607 [Actinostola sp. cb2023]|nr:hypothetical protein QZH41_001607 [Actinostola sp. cb2023]